jgi:hypothetical protein
MNTLREVEEILNSALVEKYEDIFIKVEKRGSYRESDIDENDIWLETSAPDFVSDFEQELDSKPGLAVDVCCFLYLSISFSTLAGQCRHVPLSTIPPLPNLGKRTLGLKKTTPEGGPPEEPTPGNQSHEKGKRQRRDAKLCEMVHIMDTATARWEERWANKPLKENLANIMFFSRFLNSVPENRTIIAQTYALALSPSSITIHCRIYRGTGRWPFNLVMKCADEPAGEQLRQFQPCSDFLIQKSKLPRLLVDVNSTPPRIWPEDLIRMLLTGAAIVRFANTFLKSFKTKKFMLVTMYIHEDGNVTRYTLFQKQTGREVFRTLYIKLAS